MLTVLVYRHKSEKDIYLARNWSICGGGDKTDFYYATTDINEAIKNANRDGFLSWSKSFGGKLAAKITMYKDMEFDGYTGRLKKEFCFPVSDFECVTLKEQGHDTERGK